jgi:antitoxin YefM
MAIETTYTHLRANLADMMNRVAENQETVIVRRRGAKDVAVISADELASLEETALLLRSPANAKRLLQAVNRAKKGGAKPSSVQKLRREMGLGGSR